MPQVAVHNKPIHQQLPQGWNVFFSNSDTTDCAISNCIVGSAGNCGTAASFTGLTIDTESPWTITMSTTVGGGYSHSLCVRCWNSPSSYLDVDNWNLQLTFDCSAALTAPAPYSKVIHYDPSPPSSPTLLDVTWDVFFQNADPANCPIMNCYFSTVGNC